MTVTPTAEQDDALDRFSTGESLAIEAGAGTGKTSTLVMLAESSPRRGRYLAFNKAIVLESTTKFPPNVSCATIHSIAYKVIGNRYQRRIQNAARMKSGEIARVLGLGHMTIRYGAQTKVLQPGYLAGLAVRSVVRFCQSADLELGPQHVPFIDGIDDPTKDGTPNNDELRQFLLPAMRKVWADYDDEGGVLPYKHDHYLKAWHLTGPRAAVEFLMVDEAQDLSPVMLDIVQRQTHAQLVLVGDPHQSIYAFTGAVNAFDHIDTKHRTQLSQSFRFGEAVAGVANDLLEMLGADLRLQGLASIDSSLVSNGRPDVILCRTNATAVTEIMRGMLQGRSCHLVGGGDQVVRFAEAAQLLKDEGRCWHPDLACFDSWKEVQDYCLAPGARLLTEDLHWRPVERVQVGDRLIGFDEHTAPGNGGRRYRPATVTHVRHLELPSRRVWFEDGRELVASNDHRWLVRSGISSRWKQTEMLRPGDQIASLGMPWTREDTYDTGWLAGMFDGEGSLHRRGGIEVAQKPGPVLDRLEVLLRKQGFDLARRDDRESGVVHFDILGGLGERLRLLGTLRPGRLLLKSPALWNDVRVEVKQWGVVRGVENVGPHDVVAITTDCATFIAEGLLSHNCAQDEQGHELKLLVDLVDQFGAVEIAAALQRCTRERDADLVVSTAHKAKGREWPHVKLADDFAELDPWPPDEELRLLYVAVTRARYRLDIENVPDLRYPQRRMMSEPDLGF